MVMRGTEKGPARFSRLTLENRAGDDQLGGGGADVNTYGQKRFMHIGTSTTGAPHRGAGVSP